MSHSFGARFLTVTRTGWLVLAVVLFAAACGSSGDTSAPVADPEATAEEVADEATEADAEDATSEEETSASDESDLGQDSTDAEDSMGDAAADESSSDEDAMSAAAYDAPGDLEVPQPLPAGAPGELIDVEPLALDTGEGARILYHSTSAIGEDVAVSGFVRLPAGEPPAEGWPLIAWAHGTTGLGDTCAPSINAEGDQLADALTSFGFAVVATDYEGLGTPGTHPYVVGASEAHSVLDSVRAVQQMDLLVTTEWVAFGHSQGGHAAMFTAQLQPTYAPDLELIGTVAGAPPSQMSDLGDSLVGGDFQGYLVMTSAGLAAAYPDVDLAEVFTDSALDQLDVVETGCTGEIFDVYNGLAYEDITKVDDPFALPTWGPAIEAQDTNQLPVLQPLLIIHGGEDEQIPVETSATLFSQLCAFEDQAATERIVYPGQSHAGVLTTGAAIPDLLRFFNGRFAGEPAVDGCTESGQGEAASIDDLLARDDVLAIAHAGGDQAAPHSTLFAYGEAVAAGVDVLELDVLTTADGVVVVQHDLTVDGTTNSTGLVADLTYEELDQLDNAYWFSPACWPCRDLPDADYLWRGVRTGDKEPPNGYSADDFSVATLREVAERFPALPLDIEIKGEGDQALAVAEALAAELTDLGRLDSTVVVSFDDGVVDRFHELAPTVDVSPGLDRLTEWVLLGTELEDHFRIVQIPPFAQGLEVATAERIATAHEQGLEVWVWPDDAASQENEAFYRELIERGADGVIAGRPEQMVAAKN